MNFGDAAAKLGLVIHLRRHVGEKKQLAVAGSGDEGKFLAVVHDLETRVAHGFLAAHLLQIFFPAFAVGRIRQHEIELLRGKRIMRQRGMFRAADNVVGVLALAFEQHVGLANGIGFRVDLLPVKIGGDAPILLFRQALQSFLRDGEHSARAARAIVKQIRTGLDFLRHRQKNQVRHELHGVAGRPVFASFLVVFFVELADKFLEHRAHRVVVNSGWA